jgi:hypothetical protein
VIQLLLTNALLLLTKTLSLERDFLKSILLVNLLKIQKKIHFISGLFSEEQCPATSIGCSDGQREGFTDLTAYPCIAACAASWTVPGVVGKAKVHKILQYIFYLKIQ